MRTITIHVHSEPDAPLGNGTQLNQYPRGGGFAIDEEIDSSLWKTLRDIGGCYHGDDTTDDPDAYYDQCAWTYSIRAISELLWHGMVLTIRGTTVTTVDQLNEMFSARAQAKRHARQDRRRAARDHQIANAYLAEQQRHREWRDKHLTGLVETSLQVPTEALPTASHQRPWDCSLPEWQGHYIHFNVDGFRGRHYYWLEYGGELVYVEQYRYESRLYCSHSLADRLYRKAWAWLGADNMHAVGMRALCALESEFRNFALYHDDVARWAWEHIGAAALVEQARAAEPYTLSFLGANENCRASKRYRILFIIGDWSKSQSMRGYGDARTVLRRDSDWGERPIDHQQRRLTGWVSEEDAATSPWWPTDADVLAEQAGCRL